MKTKIEIKADIDHVDTSFGRIYEVNNKYLTLVNKTMTVKLVNGKKYDIVKITLNVNRPNHDHDNYPEVTIKVPKGGLSITKSGELLIEPDNGILMLDTYYVEDHKKYPMAVEGETI